MKFAELETLLGDAERARAIYELAINQPRLDMPERTSHVKVWLSLAQFERQNDHEDRIIQARHVYEEANKALRHSREKEERLMLLEAWKDFESEDGDEKSQAQVADLMPRRVKKRRKIETEDGSDQGWEEYFDYIFPEDEAAKPNLKLLAMAKMWKKQKDTTEDDETFEDAPTAADTEEADERIPITDDKEVDMENPDADDQDIVNESRDDSEDEEDNDHETERKKARLK